MPAVNPNAVNPAVPFCASIRIAVLSLYNARQPFTISALIPRLVNGALALIAETNALRLAGSSNTLVLILIDLPLPRDGKACVPVTAGQLATHSGVPTSTQLPEEFLKYKVFTVVVASIA